MNAKPVKVVIDTQLFLRAAINRNSLPARLLFDMRDQYRLTTSLETTAEVADVLNRPDLRARFKTLTDDVVNLLLSYLAAAELVTPTETPSVSRDPKDDIFLACAKAAQANYLQNPRLFNRAGSH